MAKLKPITMDADTFDKLKEDMTNSLNRLLRDMKKYGSDKAAMTVKLTVCLDDQELDNGEKGTVPTFEHKVTTSVQIKNELDGKLTGEYTLEGDGNGGHILRPITDQVDMFEEEEIEE